MKKNSIPLFLLPFGLAALGQFFMAQADRSWSLYPGLLLYAAAIWFYDRSLTGFSPPPEKKPLSIKWEIFFFLLILFIAYEFRVYSNYSGLFSPPSGIHSDQGLTGLCALRILHEGWRPLFEVYNYQVPEPILFYQLAAWFGLVGSFEHTFHFSEYTFHLFFILLSLTAFPFIYWTIRQWAGPRAALFSLFLLSVMRWNWIETRNGYPSIQVPFYLFAALAFWTYWRKSGKGWAGILSTLFVGIGFYTYQAFKIVPLLMVIYAIYEYRRELMVLPPFEKGGWGGIRIFPKTKKKLTPPSSPSFRGGKVMQPFLVYFLIVFILILPLLIFMFQKGSIGNRETSLFIGTKIIQDHSLKPFWDVWTGTLLMFNRSGDTNPRHNIPGHRMLDDGTAVLFILGLVLAWSRRKTMEGFYPLAGFGVMMLTGLLSTDPAQSNRLVSLTPFVAYFAGSALGFVWRTTKSFFEKPWMPALCLFLLLLGVTIQNTRIYFVEQTDNMECQNAFGMKENYIGFVIEITEKHFFSNENYFIDPSLFGDHTIDFLAYSARQRVFSFNLQDWTRDKEPKNKKAWIFLNKDEWGWLGFLQTLFPGEISAPQKIDGKNILPSVITISKDALQKAKPWIKGLKGVYLNSNDWDAKPVIVQWDPVLNFTSKFDFPFTQPPPFRVRWTGTLNIPKTGSYELQILTTDKAQLWLDGRDVVLEMPLALSAGAHKLRLDFEKDSGDSLVLNFIWKKPGDDKWEVVPATVFGKIPPNT